MDEKITLTSKFCLCGIWDELESSSAYFLCRSKIDTISVCNEYALGPCIEQNTKVALCSHSRLIISMEWLKDVMDWKTTKCFSRSVLRRKRVQFRGFFFLHVSHLFSRSSSWNLLLKPLKIVMH